MKKILYILFVTTFFALISCKKDDDIAPIDQLPPATQIGAGTFGCLVNGEPFFEKNSYFNCFYQFNRGMYFFNISAEFDPKEPCNIDIGTNALEIKEGGTYNLFDSNVNGNAGAALFFCKELTDFHTNPEYTGKLVITKLDFDKQIVSGTFEFKIFNTRNNKLYQITEGRFDTKFTQ